MEVESNRVEVKSKRVEVESKRVEVESKRVSIEVKSKRVEVKSTRVGVQSEGVHFFFVIILCLRVVIQKLKKQNLVSLIRTHSHATTTATDDGTKIEGLMQCSSQTRAKIGQLNLD